MKQRAALCMGIKTTSKFAPGRLLITSLAVGSLTLAGCGSVHAGRSVARGAAFGAGDAAAHHVISGALSHHTGTVPSPGSAAGTTRTPAGGLVIADGHGWTAAGLEGAAYASETCHAGSAVFRGQVQPLPDPGCTPGAIDPGVTQANLAQTICRPGGYTASVRPPESITEAAKLQAMRAYGLTGSPSLYEFDHLSPISLGGSSDSRNLWVERNVGGTGGYILNAKDQLELDAHSSVCSGRVSLAAAQNAIATNWTTAEQTLGVTYKSGGN